MPIAQSGLFFGGLAQNKGASKSVIDRAEEIVGADFPPDFRCFLENLYDPKGIFFPWRKFNRKDYERRIETLVSGIVFDIEQNDYWRPDWGERPSKPRDRVMRIKQAVADWPKLAPLIGHRFLILEPCQTGNPVISIHQADAIYYGPDLGRYLCNEFFATGINTWVEAWRWAPTADRPEFGPWNEMVSGAG